MPAPVGNSPAASARGGARLTAPFAGPGVDVKMGAAHAGAIRAVVKMELEERYEGRARAGVDVIAAPSCGFRRQAEDVEIGYRVSAAGRRIVFVHGAPVAHRHQTGLAEVLAAQRRHAIDRMEVFDLHPAKRRHDSWPPLSLKAQFALGLAGPALPLAGLVWGRGG